MSYQFLVVAVLGMGMVMTAAGAIIRYMSYYYTNNSRSQQPIFVVDEEKLENQEGEANGEDDHWPQAVVVLTPAVVKRIDADAKCQHHHKRFEVQVVKQVDTKQWQCCEKQW